MVLNLIPLSDFINLWSWPGLHRVKRQAEMGFYKLEIEKYVLEHLDSDKTFQYTGLENWAVFLLWNASKNFKISFVVVIRMHPLLTQPQFLYLWFKNKGDIFCYIIDLTEFCISPSSTCCWFSLCPGGFRVLQNWYRRTWTPCSGIWRASEQHFTISYWKSSHVWGYREKKLAMGMFQMQERWSQRKSFSPP